MNLNISRRSLGGSDYTVIEAGDFPAIYVDHTRGWIEVAHVLRFSADTAFAGGIEATPSDVVAWMRAAADAIEAAS